MFSLSNVFRIFFFALSLAGLLLFVIPAVGFRIFNIGNVTAILVFGLLIVYQLKMSTIHAFLAKLWLRPAGKTLLFVLTVCVAAAIGLVIFLFVLMFQGASRRPATDSTVVVLGCQVKGEAPSLTLTERLDAAYDYLCSHPDAACILSGGQGDDEKISEAECMYRYLTEKGIDASRLYLEDQSTSTRENLAFSQKVIDENHLSPNIAIVTNEFHQYRAQRIADALSLNSGAVPAKTVWWLFPTFAVRELFGILYQFLF